MFKFPDQLANCRADIPERSRKFGAQVTIFNQILDNIEIPHVSGVIRVYDHGCCIHLLRR